MTVTDEPTDDEMQHLVKRSYLGLADLLETLPGERWDTPSLCEEWRIREVVAHMTMPARYTEEAFMAELRDCEFDFGRLNNRVAARDARLPTSQLVGNLRDEVQHRWIPPGGGYQGALSHVVIHGLDITVPLGESPRSPEEAIRVVLDGLTWGGGYAHFGTDISGRALRAADIDWSYGSGPPLRGSAADLVAHISGRKLPAGRLQGTVLGS